MRAVEQRLTNDQPANPNRSFYVGYDNAFAPVTMSRCGSAGAARRTGRKARSSAH